MRVQDYIEIRDYEISENEIKGEGGKVELICSCGKLLKFTIQRDESTGSVLFRVFDCECVSRNDLELGA